MKKIETINAPKVIGPYSQGIMIPANSNLIFVSGQMPIDPKSGKVIEGDIKTLTNCVIDNIEAILKSAGSGLEKVIRTDVFLLDLKRDFALMNEEYAKRFVQPIPPVRQTIQVSGLPLGVLIEISCVAIS